MRTFIYGKYEYKYKLLRLERKSLSLTVLPDLSIILRSPIDATQTRIDQFLQKKWLWLEEQLKYFKKYQRQKTVKDYVSGESFLYLGRQYKLIVKSSQSNNVALSKGVILCNTVDSVKNTTSTKEQLESWYLERAREVFSERYNEVFKNFNYREQPRLVIKKMEKRWGSFIRGKSIILNPLLIHASKDCIDYVITHELCHVKYRGHNKAFYRLLDAKYPHWEAIKEKLEERMA